MKKKSIIYMGIAIIFFVAFFDFIYSFYKFKDKINEGIYIEEIYVGELSLKEAEEKVKREYLDKEKNKKISTFINDREYSIEYKDIEVTYNLEETIKIAKEYYEKENIFLKYKNIKMPKEKKFYLKLLYNEEKFQQYIDTIKEENCMPYRNAKLKMVNGGLTIEEECIGYELDIEDLKKNVLEGINNRSLEDIYIESKLIELEPRVKKSMLDPVNSLVSSFSTTLGTSSDDRISNIELATSMINGITILSGEEFSFNKVVGERSTAKGYKNAKVIINEHLEDGIGGGVCQVSSTLYNAMIRANIDATERSGHSKRVNYVDIGQDAAVAFDYMDYKFINTLPYAIYIEGKVQGKNLNFNIYSNSSLRKKTYSVYTTNRESIQPMKIIKKDSNLSDRTEVITKKGKEGYKADVLRDTYENGKLIKREVVSKVDIKPINSEVRRGTRR